MDDSRQEKNPNIDSEGEVILFFEQNKSVPQVVAAHKRIEGQLENYTAVRKPNTRGLNPTLRLFGKPRGWKREQLLFSDVIIHLKDGYGAS